MLKLPEPAMLVTCGVDVQLRYLAVLFIGWTEECEAWVLDWSTVEGDPRDPAMLLEFVTALGDVRFEHPAGDVPVHLAAMDSGFATDHVYRAVSRAPRRALKWVYASKGFGGRAGEPIVLPFKDARDTGGHRGYRPLPINADGGKDEIMAMLKTSKPGRGYFHIPKRAGADFVKQITSEESRTKFDADGVAVGAVWKKKTADARNEALDCAVMNLALWHMVKPGQWAAFLSDRYGKVEGLERFKAMHPEITGPRPPAPQPVRRPWMQREAR